MKEELQDIENKQQEVTEIKKQQDTNDCKSINKNAAETMLVSEHLENMPVIIYLLGLPMMIKNVDKNILKSAPDKYIKFVDKKYVRGDLIVFGSARGHLLVYSLSKDTIIHDFGQILKYPVTCIAKTTDNKTLYVCDFYFNTVEIDLRTGKKLSCNRLKIDYLAVTHDDRFLFTATKNKNGWYEIQKHSARTTKLIDTLEGHQNKVCSMSISHDNKLLFLGYYCTIDIVDIQKFKVIKTTEILKGGICLMSWRQDNCGVYFGDYFGNIKVMTCKPNSYKKEDFDSSQPTKEVGSGNYSTILINGDKELLVGSYNNFYLLDANTLDTIEVFQVDGGDVKHFGLIEQDTKVLVAMKYH